MGSNARHSVARGRLGSLLQPGRDLPIEFLHVQQVQTRPFTARIHSGGAEAGIRLFWNLSHSRVTLRIKKGTVMEFNSKYVLQFQNTTLYPVQNGRVKDLTMDPMDPMEWVWKPLGHMK
jgi:hypothetical protein